MKPRSLEEECGVARRVSCAPGNDPFSVPRAIDSRRQAQFELLFAAFLPFFLFILIITAFTYGQLLWWPLPWLIALLSVDLLLTGNWPTKPQDELGARDWIPLFLALSVAGAAVFIGLWSGQVLQPWIAVEKFPERADVEPTDKGAAYLDAGILHFAEGSQVDVDSSVGFEVWPIVYCAAPIFDAQGSTSDSTDVTVTPTKVAFWAIGHNCCDSRGGFHCGDSTDLSVRSAIHAMHQQGDQRFELAIKKAAADNELVVGDHPIMVFWEKDPAGVAEKALMYSAIIVGSASLVALILSAIMMTVLKRA
eukprot:CAMPEP_0206436204 /NCGR_PEP_ID=MMETSP0324_2-20121206/10346_1 /ASSEMBLY_ACC=CAM_ASM_000836 /TAXON_ID=2866 /ORGANISM="Crypthecodinium cohnii, Strain Seligo" /LENGTH=306 /DNA_ID=CAMNT_0053903329 /DNA_START=83 /DNA_END=999 /DNA_ORIENTATION=-